MTPNVEATSPAGIHHTTDLPERPVVRIAPGRQAFDPRELWEYRDLLYFLTWRDISVRYRQTLLGIVWAIVQPAFTVLVFTLLFGRLAKLPSDGVPYSVFAYAGVLLWMFFSNALANSGASLVANVSLITKVYFPRILVPAASVAAGLVDLTFGYVILIGLMVYHGLPIGVGFLLIPLVIIILTILAIGIGTWFAAMNVAYRDVRYVLSFGIQLLMFVTPIIYPLSLVPERWRFVVELNPLTGIIEAHRAILFQRPINWAPLGMSAVVTVVMLAYSIYAFRNVERKFADVI